MPTTTRQAFIGAGANLGDRWATMQSALTALARVPRIGAVEASSVYETDPVGVTDQPLFLNLVAGVETTLTPEALFAALIDIELAAGRRREVERRWGPRTLDLDLLLYEAETRNGPDLTLPHPRLWERTFVTVPLGELLSRKGRFSGPNWAAIRQRLTATSQSGAGVRLWNPPKSTRPS